MQNDFEEIRDELLQTVQALVKKYTPKTEIHSHEADMEFADFIVTCSSTLIELGYSLAGNLNERTATALIEMATTRGETIFKNTQDIVNTYYENNSFEDVKEYAAENNLGVKMFDDNVDGDENLDDDNYDLKNMKPLGTA